MFYMRLMITGHSHINPPRIGCPMHGVYFSKMAAKCAPRAHLYSTKWLDIGSCLKQTGICCCFSGLLQSEGGIYVHTEKH